MSPMVSRWKCPIFHQPSNDTHSRLMLRVRAIYYVLVDSTVLKYVCSCTTIVWLSFSHIFKWVSAALILSLSQKRSRASCCCSCTKVNDRPPLVTSNKCEPLCFCFSSQLSIWFKHWNYNIKNTVKTKVNWIMGFRILTHLVKESAESKNSNNPYFAATVFT